MFEVYDDEHKWRATCLHVEEAARLVAFLGEGATIRVKRDCWVEGMKVDRYPVCWTEGADGEAHESYDAVAELVHRRASKINPPGAACPTE